MPNYSSGFGGNYPGSSGYNTDGTPIIGTRYAAVTPSDPNDFLTMDATGLVTSKRTGKPFTGKSQQNGLTYKNGRQDLSTPIGVSVPGTNQTIDPNNPTQRYKPVDIVKDPAIASGTADLLDTFKKSAADSLKGFDDYLATFKAGTADAMAKTKAATDIGPLTDNLRGQQTQYAGALNKSAAEIAALNANDAAAQRGIVAQAQATLPEIDAGYQDALNRDLASVQGNVSRYKTTSGTPSSLGSSEMRIQDNANQNLLVPFELAKSQRKLDILQNLALPVQRDITGRETSRITQFDPQVAAQQFQSGTATESQIQGLKTQVAGMSWDSATRYMQSLGVPAAIQQQILSGQIQTLGGISQLNAGSRYQGLQDVLGANLSQPVGYSIAQPALPAPNRYSSVTGTPLAPNAPVQVGGTVTGNNGTLPPSDPNRYQSDPTSGGYWDLYTGQFYPFGTPAAGAAQSRYANVGPQNNSTAYESGYITGPDNFQIDAG